MFQCHVNEISYWLAIQEKPRVYHYSEPVAGWCDGRIESSVKNVRPYLHTSWVALRRPCPTTRKQSFMGCFVCARGGVYSRHGLTSLQTALQVNATLQSDTLQPEHALIILQNSSLGSATAHLNLTMAGLYDISVSLMVSDKHGATRSKILPARPFHWFGSPWRPHKCVLA